VDRPPPKVILPPDLDIHTSMWFENIDVSKTKAKEVRAKRALGGGSGGSLGGFPAGKNAQKTKEEVQSSLVSYIDKLQLWMGNWTDSVNGQSHPILAGNLIFFFTSQNWV
jgi:hypothetical protein